MMPHGQKHEQDLTEAPREAEGRGDEKALEAKDVGDRASSSSALVPSTPEKVSGAQISGAIGSTKRARSSFTLIQATLSGKSMEGSSGVTEKYPHTSQPLPYSQFLLRTLKRKVVDVVKFLCLKYESKEPVTETEMMKNVIKEHKYYFPMIFKNVCECMEVVFGIEVKEVDTSNHAYALVKILDLTYDGGLSGDTVVPTSGILMLVLGVIFKEGNCASEEKIWEVLRRMNIYPDKCEFLCPNPKKLVSEEFVQEGYLVCQQVPLSDPPRFEFRWGPKAHAETSKMKVLKFYAKVSGRSPTECLDLYREALRDEEERAECTVAIASASPPATSVGTTAKPGTE